MNRAPLDASIVDQLETAIAVFKKESGETSRVEPIWVNQHFQSAVGYSLNDLKSIGLSFIEPIIEGDAQQRIMDQIKGFTASRSRLKIRTKTGNAYLAFVKTKPFRHPDETGDFIILTVEDSAELSPELNTSQWDEFDQDDLDIKAVQINERFLRSAVAAAGVGLWEWHVPSSHVVYSPEWFTMLGYEPDEYPSGFQTFELLTRNDDTVDVLAKADQAFIGELDEYESRFRMRCKDGSWKWIKSFGRVTERDASGKAVHIYGTHIDISVEQEREEALRQALEKAEQARKAKERFLAVMSHEIRTPLNGIMGMIDFVLGSELTEKQTEYLDIALLSSRNLLEILNDTLDYSKLESGSFQVEAINFDARELIHGLAALFSAKTEADGIAINTNIDPAFPVSLLGDPTKFRQIAINLIGNAVKFTNTGSVTISLSEDKAVTGKDAHLIRLDVIDTGVGIPNAAKAGIFDSFTQADSSTSRQFGGTGLGLAITKKLVELLRGTISFTSEEGVGTSFTVTIPMAAANIDDLPTNRNQGPILPAFEQHHAGVLIVEDHPINRQIIEKLVGDLGLAYDTAENGAVAIEKAKARQFDLILMDIQMPVMDGIDATKTIRSNPNANQHTPIIALTAHAVAGDRENYLAIGMNDYVAKPIDKEVFHQCLLATLRREASDTSKTAVNEGATAKSEQADDDRLSPLKSSQAKALDQLIATL